MNDATEFVLKPRVAAWALAALIAAFGGTAEADGPYVRIEQDWELILNTPDLSFPSPQIVIPMKSWPGSSKTALFLVNHHDYPAFAAGGGQIQIWNGDTLQSTKSFAGPTLIRDGERVTWTQYLERKDGKLHFGLSAVEGEAWGTNTADTLGGPVAMSDSISNFTAYESPYSTENAEISFGDERVHSLKLVEVRKHRSDGHVDIESSRTVFP